MVVQPVMAETLISAREFETWSLGKTLDFGTEEFLPDRRVRWVGTDGQCLTGQWYSDYSLICFAYEGFSDQHCWTFWREGDSVTARSALDRPDIPPRQVTEARRPLSCAGPDLGV